MISHREFTNTAYDAPREREIKVGHPIYRKAAYALLRVTMGLVFLATGIGKFLMGVGMFAAGLQQQFTGKLPAVLVGAFGYALPFIEVLVGGLLLLGLFNVFGLIIGSLLMMALTFGTMWKGDPATTAHNLSYALIFFILLWLSEYNGYSIDHLRRGR
ncbi:MAG TPA: MauE/DoxX family redox-associated membrane protein [Blastocatellia bacterium]|nr:MauE/DoxX family redox-associated membrane protein [Blastocatellia bacterium]